jgi:para-aminobenzoate synthetase component 1
MFGSLLKQARLDFDRGALPGEPIVQPLKPAPDPWEVCQRLAGLPHVVFFDSSARDQVLGRYSFVAADPFAWLTSRGRLCSISGCAGSSTTDPFSALAEALAGFRMRPVPGLPPFQGGAAGMFGYDLCHHLETLPRPRIDEFEIPDSAIGLYDWIVAFDHMANEAWCISTGLPETHLGPRSRRARKRLQHVLQLLRSESLPPATYRPTRPVQLSASHSVLAHSQVASNLERASYMAMVARAIAYIHAGDCFQVNLAQRLVSPSRMRPLDLYGRLRMANPAPHAGYFDMGSFVLASASPERFLKLHDGEAQARPIKGTRPRGRSREEDAANEHELLTSSKDRAENVMIVDLLRNDLGRVCRYHSVRVPALCRLEKYADVHHLVSEVTGRLRDGMGALDLLRAAFPGGSVTGAPKVRAMEIIAELEPTARGPYCGCLGYIGFDGAMDTSILIRTFTIGKGWVQFPVGGGIVADSVPAEEYDETWHKAAGLLRAL